MENGGILQIILEKDYVVDIGMSMDVADNRILAVAFSLYRQGHKVIFVSKDINARLKADALLPPAQLHIGATSPATNTGGHHNVRLPDRSADRPPAPQT